MIRYVRSDKAQPGKWSEAREEARRFAKFINENCSPTTPLEVLTPISGTGDRRVTMVADFEDMGVWERWWQSLTSQEGMSELMSNWAKLFILEDLDVRFYWVAAPLE